MPYTLAKFLVWGLLLAFVGGVIGWMLRSLTCRRQVAAARAATVDNTELERLQHRVANLEPVVAERDRLREQLAQSRPGRSRAQAAATADAVDTGLVEDAPELDLAAAAAVLGGAVRLDDLTVVEGIGPKIAELCHGVGIHTWRDLASTDVGLLRTMLEDAGPRYTMHDPSTWPQQAMLLSEGHWTEFKTLTDELTGGR